MTVHVHAWLEERELPGLEPAFRARLDWPQDRWRGVGSIAELHRVLDEVLAELFDDTEGTDAR